MQPKKANPDEGKTGLTVSKLRTYTGFENFSDEQAQEAIAFVKRMAHILFSMYQTEHPPRKSRQ